MGTTVELTIEKLVAGGDGLAFNDGIAVFVPMTIPGERVLVELEEYRKDWVRGNVLEILEASPDRIGPACPYFGSCGGCNLQHVDYRRQLELKAAIVEESWKRVGKVDAPGFSVVASVPYAYRSRMQFHVDDEGRIGFMRGSSSLPEPVETCPVAVEPIRTWIERMASSGKSRLPMSPWTQPGARFMVFSPERSGDRVFIEGRDGDVTAQVRGRPMRFHVKGFFQSNLYLFDLLVAAATSDLGGGHALDLYCGVGPFASFLADSFESVTAVEHDPFAVEYARMNAGGRGEFLAQSAEDWTTSDSAKSRFDAVVCDPPRSGLSERVRSWFREAKPPVVSYVSCDPVTCARDVGDLVRSGYSIDWMKVFDFYPQTSHVELCVRLVAGI
ncbi:MAG: class I SAM-dependent RNA methyltransferase [Spirochaetes bacterium]|nr:class I SAM-dependent RNA methyltransferase [Spirochaetota bacterium]